MNEPLEVNTIKRQSIQKLIMEAVLLVRFCIFGGCFDPRTEEKNCIRCHVSRIPIEIRKDCPSHRISLGGPKSDLATNMAR